MSKPIIPDAALGQHIAVLGKTGSGKSYAAKAVIVEPLLAAGRRVGIVDPTGAWYGLRSSRSGAGAGYPILVLGGDHGDLPLPALGGAAVARLLSEQGVSLVADTSQLTVGERTRWFIDFAGTVSRLNRSPLHLVLDEAHNFAPQGKVPDPDTGKMLHAANRLASEGRSRGIRLVMITQRPQKLHKDTLTSADTLIAMRVLAPHDRMAVEDWIKGCGDMAAGKEVLNSLAGLQRGEGWVWYPEGGHLARVKFPQIKTFDSSATPTDGHAVTAPKGAAEIDLTEIRAALADAVKEAEANDPKLLRAEVTSLKAELAKAGHSHVEVSRAPGKATLMEAEQRGYARGHLEALKAGQHLITEAKRHASTALGNANTLVGHLADLEIKLQLAERAAHDAPRGSTRLSNVTSPRMGAGTAPPYRGNGSGEPNPSIGNSGLRRILIALAQRPQGLTQRALGVRAGLSARSGTFATYLSKGRSEGWILGSGNQAIRITDAGLKALGSYEPLPEGRELLAYWLGELDGGAARILQALAEVYPRQLTRDEAAERASLSAASGTFATYLSKLRTLELIAGKGELLASEELFDG